MLSGTLFSHLRHGRKLCFRSYSAIQQAVDVAYVQFNDAEVTDTTKTPLVVVHGLFGSSQNWRSVGKALNARLKRQVVLTDMRNHGDSPHVDSMHFSEMAADVERLLTRIKAPGGKAIVLGHSMGGLVACYLTLTQPSVIEKLIVEDVAPRSYSDRQGLERSPWTYVDLLVAARWQSKDLSEARKEVDRQLADKIENATVRQFLLLNLIEQDGKIKWRLNLNALQKAVDYLANFPSDVLSGRTYNGPTLIVKGQDSDYIRDDDMSRFKTMFPQSRLATIPNAGHWVHAQQPTEFIKCIEAFVNE